MRASDVLDEMMVALLFVTGGFVYLETFHLAALNGRVDVPTLLAAFTLTTLSGVLQWFLESED